MKRKNADENGFSQLKDAFAQLALAQATLTQSQAALNQNQAHFNELQAIHNQQMAAINARLTDAERETAKTIAEGKSENAKAFAAVFEELAEHRRILEELPEAVRGKMGFRPQE